ncbi:MAG: class I SAM-dependent methyltransferase [Bryobacterales bacterium]|nr:class I SAM-dependent methyltransferase [Bryobacterales bacterium]
MKTYRLWAAYYDRIFPFARSWGAVVREQLLDPLLPNCTTVCDLACGTGTTAMELAQLGLRVYAVDLSPTMCEITRRKVRRTRPPITVIQADMRSFRLPEPVDLITCEFDAINHVPHKQDLARVAHAAARALKPGGHFYFDANNLLAFQEVWPLTWRHELPGVVIVSHGRYDAERERAYNLAEFFIRHGKLWERHLERIEQVCWNQKEIRAALREAGFESVRAHDAARFFPPGSMIDRGHRTIYLARKNRAA